MTKKTPVDWEAIERAYRAGIMSLREIAAKFGTKEGTIRSRAKAHEWERDLTGRVRERAREKLSRTSPGTEAQIIEEGSEVVVQVVRSHRRDIRASKDTFSLLLAELHAETANQDTLQAIIDQHIDGNELDARAASAIRRAVSLPSRAGVMRDLTQSLQRLVALERQAYSVDDPAEDGKGTLESALIEGMRRVKEQYGD